MIVELVFLFSTIIVCFLLIYHQLTTYHAQVHSLAEWILYHLVNRQPKDDSLILDYTNSQLFDQIGLQKYCITFYDSSNCCERRTSFNKDSNTVLQTRLDGELVYSVTSDDLRNVVFIKVKSSNLQNMSYLIHQLKILDATVRVSEHSNLIDLFQ